MNNKPEQPGKKKLKKYIKYMTMSLEKLPDVIELRKTKKPHTLASEKVQKLRVENTKNLKGNNFVLKVCI